MATECSDFDLELDDAALGAALPHLESCAACRQRVEARRSLWAAVRSLPQRRAAPAVRAAVLAATPSPAVATGTKLPAMRPARDVRSAVLAAARASRPGPSRLRVAVVAAAITAIAAGLLAWWAWP